MGQTGARVVVLGALPALGHELLGQRFAVVDGGQATGAAGIVTDPSIPVDADLLDEAGSSLEKIASVTVVLADEDDFAGMNEEWLRWFPANPPARQGAKLPARIPGLKVSIAAIAEA